jgi:hypothetical protein
VAACLKPETELDHDPVVQDLGDRVGVVDRVLEVGHQHEVLAAYRLSWMAWW